MRSIPGPEQVKAIHAAKAAEKAAEKAKRIKTEADEIINSMCILWSSGNLPKHTSQINDAEVLRACMDIFESHGWKCHILTIEGEHRPRISFEY